MGPIQDTLQSLFDIAKPWMFEGLVYFMLEMWKYVSTTLGPNFLMF